MPTTTHPLARRLAKLGWTQADLAARVGLSRPFISQVLSGARQKFSLEDARKIRRVVKGIPLEQLVTPHHNTPRR